MDHQDIFSFDEALHRLKEFEPSSAIFLTARSAVIASGLVVDQGTTDENRIKAELKRKADPKTYTFLSSGLLPHAIPPLSESMMDMLEQMKPDQFKHIVASIALYRPGPLCSGLVDRYIDHKNRDNCHGVIPEISKIVKETYGLVLYKQQLNEIVSKYSGLNKNEADRFTKAISSGFPLGPFSSHKDRVHALEIENFREKFCSDCQSNGIDSGKVNQLFDELKRYTGCYFDRATADDYGYIVYWSAWLKVHYPICLRAGSLTASFGDRDKIQDEVWNCREEGIMVLAPDINQSDSLCTLEGDGAIRMGLTATGISHAVATHIVETRTKCMDKLKQEGNDTPWAFITFEDFLQGVDLNLVQTDDVKTLIKAGAFRYVLANACAAYEAAHAMIRELSKTGKVAVPANDIIDGNWWSTKQKLHNEFEIIGAYVNSHPLRGHIPWFAENLGKLSTPEDSIWHRHTILARVMSVEIHTESTQTEESGFGTVWLDDPFSRKSIFFSSDNLQKFRHYLKPNNLLLVELGTILPPRNDEAHEARIELKNVQSFNREFPKISKNDFSFSRVVYLTEKYYAELYLDRAAEMLRSIDPGCSINPDQISLDDQETYQYIWNCPELLFDLCGTKSNNAFKKLRPDNFDELLNTIVLGAPHNTTPGTTHAYIDIASGNTAPSYLIPELKPLLEKTFGFMLYREQFIEEVETLAGFSNEDARAFQRTLARKGLDEMPRAQKKFLKAVTNVVMSEDEANDLFDWLEKWAGYVRSREHLLEPATICYRIAWMKVHHQEIYRKAVKVVDRETVI